MIVINSNINLEVYFSEKEKYKNLTNYFIFRKYKDLKLYNEIDFEKWNEYLNSFFINSSKIIIEKNDFDLSEINGLVISIDLDRPFNFKKNAYVKIKINFDNFKEIYYCWILDILIVPSDLTRIRIRLLIDIFNSIFSNKENYYNKNSFFITRTNFEIVKGNTSEIAKKYLDRNISCDDFCLNFPLDKIYNYSFYHENDRLSMYLQVKRTYKGISLIDTLEGNGSVASPLEMNYTDTNLKLNEETTYSSVFVNINIVINDFLRKFGENYGNPRISWGCGFAPEYNSPMYVDFNDSVVESNIISLHQLLNHTLVYVNSAEGLTINIPIYRLIIISIKKIKLNLYRISLPNSIYWTGILTDDDNKNQLTTDSINLRPNIDLVSGYSELSIYFANNFNVIKTEMEIEKRDKNISDFNQFFSNISSIGATAAASFINPVAGIATGIASVVSNFWSNLNNENKWEDKRNIRIAREKDLENQKNYSSTLGRASQTRFLAKKRNYNIFSLFLTIHTIDEENSKILSSYFKKYGQKCCYYIETDYLNCFFNFNNSYSKNFFIRIENFCQNNDFKKFFINDTSNFIDALFKNGIRLHEVRSDDPLPDNFQ